MKNQKKENSNSVSSIPVISRGRLWFFRIILFILIPILLLVVLEIGLRLAGYGYSTSVFKTVEIENQTFICDNPSFSWRFFPAKVAREYDPFIFPKEKPQNTFRIFVLGSSPAQGVPDGAFSFARILEVMLRKTYPSMTFEVINTSITAINSHVVREIALQSSRYEPDLFIIYMGNNEIVGPYGPGTVFTPISSSLTAIRFGMAIKKTRLGQLLSDLLSSIDQKEDQQEWKGLEMFLGNRVSPNDPRIETAYRHFHRNLQDIRKMAVDTGSPIIFCTVANNLKDCPPFASLHKPGFTDSQKTQWENLYTQGIHHEEAQQYQEAIQQYLEAHQIDETYADLHFRLGQCYLQLEQYEKARQWFLSARETDALRFRADQQIQKIIREIAPTADNADNNTKPSSVYLADIAETFKRQSQHRLPGKELFFEHVHMTFHGNYVLAWSLFRKVQQVLAATHTQLKPALSLPPTQKECRQELAYTLWEHFNTLKSVLYDYIMNPPYTNQLYHPQRVGELEQQINYYSSLLTEEVLQQIAQQYTQALEHKPADSWLRKKYAQYLYQVLKDYPTALEQYRMLSYGLPHSYEGYAGMGYMHYFLGQYKEAIEENLEALKRHPYKPDVLNNLALAYQFDNQTEKAITYYKQAIKLRPRYIPAHYNLAGYLQKLGRKDDSLNVLRTALTFNPDSAKLKDLLKRISEAGE